MIYVQYCKITVGLNLSREETDLTHLLTIAANCCEMLLLFLIEQAVYTPSVILMMRQRISVSHRTSAIVWQWSQIISGPKTAVATFDNSMGTSRVAVIKPRLGRYTRLCPNIVVIYRYLLLL